ILRDWITAGLPPDPPGAPTLERLEVSPTDKILFEPTNEIQLHARAVFSNGSTRDATRMAVYETANGLVNVTHNGVVQRQGSGETTVLVRYLRAQVPVRLAFMPARSGFVWKNPPVNNYIDEQLFAKLRALRINPSDLCTDNEFIRRAYLDLLGIPPTAEEAKAFVNEDVAPLTPSLSPSDGERVAARPGEGKSTARLILQNPKSEIRNPKLASASLRRRLQKRARLIDRLLERPEFADFWALKWADLLRAEERLLDRKGIETFHRWIRRSIAENKPLDRFARELIAARGSTYFNPAANFYRAIREPVARAEAVAQVFLGTQLRCAQCHNHPFDKWRQDDYYDWADEFARVNYKVLENRRRDNNDGHEFKGEQIVYVADRGEVKNPRSGKTAHPRFLGQARPLTQPATRDTEDAADSDGLDALAEWVTSPDNPFFARAQVNRIWFHLMGRGIVDLIDDFRATNPPSHPELLDALAKDFVEHGYDVRYLICLIMNSQAYGLSSEPNETNADDE